MSDLRRINVELTADEFAAMQSALLTQSQLFQEHVPRWAEHSWSALSKLVGVPDARTVYSTKLPTVEDTAALLADIELELAKQRTAKPGAGGAR